MNIVNPQDLLCFPRTPVYWYMNLNQEQIWNDVNVFPSITDRHQLELVMRQEQQQLFLARADDRVLLRHQPDPQFLIYLRDKGFDLPTTVQITGIDSFFSQNSNGAFVPYIVSEEVQTISDNYSNVSVFGGNLELVKRLNNKFETRRLAQQHRFNVTTGYFCENIAELQEAYQHLHSSGFQKCVIKIPFGSSGKGLKLIEDETSFRLFCRFIQRRGDQFELLLEGWHPIQRSLNSQLLIQDNEVLLLAVTEQKVDEYGVYRGTNFCPQYDSSLLTQYKSEILRLGHILQSLGYSGIAGIDSIIDETGSLFPIIEINARLTQVTYLLPVVSRLMQTCSFIESRMLQFASSQLLTFDQVQTHIETILEPDSRNGFLIYTYAVTTDNERNYLFRVYLIFYGNDRERVQTMIEGISLNRFSV